MKNKLFRFVRVGARVPAPRRGTGISDFDQLGQLNFDGGGGGFGFLKVASVEDGLLLLQNIAKAPAYSNAFTR